MKKTMVTVVLLALVMGIPATLTAQTPNSPNDFEIANSALGGVKITKYIGTRQDVVIPATIDGMRVTELDSASFVHPRTSLWGIKFSEQAIINSVVLPNTLIAIRSDAFINQPLTSISFPNSLRIIESTSFLNTGLSSVVIPNGVTFVESNAFAECLLITSVVIPPSLVNYSERERGFAGAFGSGIGCGANESINRITLPANVVDRNFGVFSKNGDIFFRYFPNNLYEAYVGNNRQAGTYTWTGRIWTTSANAVPAPATSSTAPSSQPQSQPQSTSTAAAEKAAVPTYMDNGTAAFNRSDWDRAITEFTRVIRIDPKYAMAYNNRGAAYNGKSDWDRAIADFSEAVRLDPNYAAPYRHRAFAYMQKGNYAQARTDVNRALQINPNYQNAKELSAELQRRGY